MFESRISAGAKENYRASREFDAETISAWSQVTQRNVWKCLANLRVKRLTNLSTSQRHAWMTNLKKKTSQLDDNLQVAHNFIRNVCMWPELGGLILCGLLTDLLVW